MSPRIKLVEYYSKIYPHIKIFRGTTFLFSKLQAFAMNEHESSYSINLCGQKVTFQHHQDFFATYLSEKAHIEEFMKELKEDTIIYDVGSWRGFYSIIGPPNTKSFAFEIDDENIEKIKLNRSLNSNKKINIVDKAVWNKNEVIKVQTGNNSTNKINSGEKEIEAITIDSFTSNHKNPDIIKIDVEGAEKQVLEGAKKTLQNQKPHNIY